MALEPSEKYQCGTSLSVMSFVKNLKIGKTKNFQFRRAYCQYKTTPFFSVWMWKPIEKYSMSSGLRIFSCT